KRPTKERRRREGAGARGYCSSFRICWFIWLASDSALTAALVSVWSVENLLCTWAMSASVIDDFAESKFCSEVLMTLLWNDIAESWAPTWARSAEIVVMAVV